MRSKDAALLLIVGGVFIAGYYVYRKWGFPSTFTSHLPPGGEESTPSSSSSSTSTSSSSTSTSTSSSSSSSSSSTLICPYQASKAWTTPGTDPCYVPNISVLPYCSGCTCSQLAALITGTKNSIASIQSALSSLASNPDLVAVAMWTRFPPPCYGTDKYGGYRIMTLEEYNESKPYQPHWNIIPSSCLQSLIANAQNAVATLQAAYDQCNCSACG